MPAAPEPALAALQTEISALQAEVEWLRAERVEKAALQAVADQYHRSQVRFHTVFENSPLGHKIIASDLTIEHANLALAIMLGVDSPAELVGRRILEFAHPHHRADWHELQERLWGHKTPNFSLETCLVRPDGTTFWCRVTSVLFADQTGEMGYTTLEDISPSKEAEDALQRLYDAQETVMHLIAHDLKSPLANIQMLTEVLLREAALLDTVPAGTPQEARHLVALIQQSCVDANALLRDVLYLGELDAKRLQKQSTNLNAFLEARLPPYHVAAQQKGIELRLEVPPHALYARVHPDKFTRVLDNLLTNALKFTPPRGHVAVTLGEHNGRVRLCVRDTGVGIPTALHEHLFDKFSAAARTGLYGDTATGMGLFITKQIVQLHGGKIWVESQEHEGATFCVELR